MLATASCSGRRACRPMKVRDPELPVQSTHDHSLQDDVIDRHAARVGAVDAVGAEYPELVAAAAHAPALEVPGGRRAIGDIPRQVWIGLPEFEGGILLRQQ